MRCTERGRREPQQAQDLFDYPWPMRTRRSSSRLRPPPTPQARSIISSPGLRLRFLAPFRRLAGRDEHQAKGEKLDRLRHESLDLHHQSLARMRLDKIAVLPAQLLAFHDLDRETRHVKVFGFRIPSTHPARPLLDRMTTSRR